MNSNKMSFRKFNSILFAFIFLALGQLVSARGDQELVLSGSWVYDSLNYICLEQKIVNFADSTPLTISQIKTLMNEVDYNSLSDAGRGHFNKLIQYFKEEAVTFDSDLIYFGLEPEVALESYYKSNSNIDWVYDRYHRNSLIESPFVFGSGDLFTVKMDLALRQNKGMAYHNDNYSNVPLAQDQIDIHFPKYGYLATEKKISDSSGIAFKFGIFDRNIGRTDTGSCIMSEYLTGCTNAQLEIYSPDYKYTLSATQFNVDKYYYQHQLDFRLFKKFTFTILEGLLVNAPMELRYLNPLIIYHGYAPWRDYDTKDDETHTGSLMGLKAQFVPFSGLRFYGLFAMTQFQTSFELENFPNDVTPNGMCGQLGAEFVRPFRDGYLRFALEGYYAEPYMYIKESPDWTFVRTYQDNIGDYEIFYEWIGSPFGPDTISGELSAGYNVPDKYSLDLIYLFMARGEMSGTAVFDSIADYWGGTNINDGFYDTENRGQWCYPDKGEKGQGFTEAKRRQGLVTPTGTPEYVNRISARLNYKFNKKLSVTVQPSFVFVFNTNHEEDKFNSGFEAAIAAKYRFIR